ncbi:uncharacterized protein SAPINGB_P004005 [Magnusiomyces paraingens]|uniref:NADH dehydrogenase [ubiquinone] 1 beta subcomplex subunit 2 n=1 Tax=Magnusiomyces paraingens TaxID=2606893 RepID=A0A5E8BXQ3_9ASCO|nr:uncharacterized protein SAPINGB_P004005 [Saprochaete ingens]VVT54297.1 unnamed protein product [Saprochaete ingens]
MGASHGHYKPYGPVPFPHVARSHRFISKFLGATMWFWIFYRVREDGGVILGLRHPWEHGSSHHAIEEGKEEHH